MASVDSTVTHSLDQLTVSLNPHNRPSLRSCIHANDRRLHCVVLRLYDIDKQEAEPLSYCCDSRSFCLTYLLIYRTHSIAAQPKKIVAVFTATIDLLINVSIDRPTDSEHAAKSTGCTIHAQLTCCFSAVAEFLVREMTDRMA